MKTKEEIIRWYLEFNDQSFEPLESGRVRFMRLSYIDCIDGPLNEDVTLMEMTIGVEDVKEFIIERALVVEDYERCARISKQSML